MANEKSDDGRLDLVLTRTTKVPRALLWRCWTEPEHLMPWFCPLPWKTIDCEIDLKPGGIFRTTMLSPEARNSPTSAAISRWCATNGSCGPMHCCRATGRRRIRFSPAS